ncbi:MAG: GMC family oxidoreductase N-terminal domain-containing protein, partial [Pseudomonadales bacterium]|nr:GMC family oxidoreductase N-terminal domain-containing protein [Pseudomonadales bacterium]
MGLSGWGWEDVIDTFKTAETDLDFLDSPIHGNSGPLTVRRWHREEMGRAQITFFDGMIETGESPISDINDRSQLPGLGVFPVTIDNNGNRVSTSLAYLTEEVRNRENLEIVTHAEVTRVVFNGTNAEGVSLANGEELTAERLAEAGVELVITARREERLNNAAREISDKYGVSVTPVVADSSTEEGREALYA